MPQPAALAVGTSGYGRKNSSSTRRRDANSCGRKATEYGTLRRKHFGVSRLSHPGNRLHLAAQRATSCYRLASRGPDGVTRVDAVAGRRSSWCHSAPRRGRMRSERLSLHGLRRAAGLCGAAEARRAIPLCQRALRPRSRACNTLCARPIATCCITTASRHLRYGSNIDPRRGRCQRASAPRPKYAFATAGAIHQFVRHAVENVHWPTMRCRTTCRFRGRRAFGGRGCA